MKQIAVGIAVLVLAVAGCASDPAKRAAVAEVEVARLAPTVKPLSEFRDYEVPPILMSTGVSADGDKVEVSRDLEAKIQARVNPLLARWRAQK